MSQNKGASAEPTGLSQQAATPLRVDGPSGFDPSRVTSLLIADLAKFDWEIVCEGCGAPLFDGDDYVSDPDGCSGCWAAMTDLPSKRDRPCFAYRVGKPVARQP